MWILGLEGLTNRPQFSMVYTLIDHRNDVINFQNLSGTTSHRQVASLQSFEH